MLLVTDLLTRKGDRVGDRKIKAITSISADKIYELIIAGPRGPRPRQGEKVVGLCARAWSVVHRLYPRAFDRDIPNPWRGVTKNRRVKAIKPAATRDQVYTFANTAIQSDYSEAAAAAVVTTPRERARRAYPMVGLQGPRGAPSRRRRTTAPPGTENLD
jgi:hypothetical protein